MIYREPFLTKKWPYCGHTLSSPELARGSIKEEYDQNNKNNRKKGIQIVNWR